MLLRTRTVVTARTSDTYIAGVAILGGDGQQWQLSRLSTAIRRRSPLAIYLCNSRVQYLTSVWKRLQSYELPY